MISYVVPGVGMDEGTQRSSVDDEPRGECAELLRREDVHFKHSNWMGSDWFFPDFVDSELGDYILLSQRMGGGIGEEGCSHSRLIRSCSSLAKVVSYSSVWQK